MIPPAAWAALLGSLAPLIEPTHQADRVDPSADTERTPERFRLPPGAFEVIISKTHDLPESEVEVFALTYPSAVHSKHPENNLVHAEYFCPKSPTAQLPAAVVFDILDGAGAVSRGQAVWLASQGVPAVRVILPYYGPRRPPVAPGGGKLRFLSADIAASLDNVRQGVLDGRRAAQWLASRPEIDAERISVVGTSLGSFVGSLVAASEPRISGAALLLGGGGLVEAFSTHPKAAGVLPMLSLLGITTEMLKTAVAPIDPVTYADQLKTKRLLLIGASRDDVVPPVALTTLWEATGRPKIVWFDSTHVGTAAFTYEAMREVIQFVRGVITE